MKNLSNTLSKIHAEGINDKLSLISNANLYEEFFLGVYDFIDSTVFRSRTNINKLTELRKLGVDTEDLRMDCLERIITKVGIVLSNDLECQIPYIYTICNNIIIDSYRKAIKESGIIISLDEALNSPKAIYGSKKSTSLNDYLMVSEASPETKYIAKDAIIEIFQKYRNNADNLLCILATKLCDDKPNELAAQLISEGSVDAALASYKHELADRFGISISEFPSVLPAKITGLSRLLRQNNLTPYDLSSKISNILSRTK